MHRLALFFVLCTVFASAQVQYESLIRSQEASCCDGCPITCPPRWTSTWNFEHGELTSQPNNEAYACRVPSSAAGGGTCKTVMPGPAGANTNWDTIWARQGRCKLRCPPKPWIAGTGFTIGDQVFSHGHGYKCIVSGTACGSPPYEPGVGPFWWFAWSDISGDCQQQLCRGEVWKIGTPYALGEVVQRTVSGIVQLYQCINSALCGSASAAYAPGTGANTAQAWTEVGACREPCDGCKLCLPTCPVNRWIRRPAGTQQPVYTGVGVVYSPLTGDHYQCYRPANCDQPGFEPGVGSNWPLAWINLGKCHNRCPLIRWALQTNYVSNTRVYHQGRAYRCLNGHTSSTTTEPGAGSFWTAYWRDEGLCHRPTCPRLQWNPQTSYVNGDQVVGQAGASDTRYYCTEASRCRGDANSPPNGAWLDYGPCKKPCCKEACLPTCPVRIWVANAPVSSGTQLVHKGVQYQCLPTQGQTCSVEPGVHLSWRTEWRWIGPCQHRCPLDIAGVAILWRSGGSYPASSNSIYQPADGHMYACTQPSLCGSNPYEPGVGPLWPVAWIDLGECQLKHCPKRQFVRSQQYALGEEVLVPTNDVYICIDPSLCSSTNSAYWPPTGTSLSKAWKYHGKCKPKCDCEKDCLWTCATTVAWKRSASYVAGSIVYNDVTGHTYRCYDPANCPLPNYSPGVPPGPSWPLAWYDEGPCRLNCGSSWSSTVTYAQNTMVYNHATGHNYLCYSTGGCPAGYQYQPGVGPLSWSYWKDLGPCSLRRCPNAHWVQGYAYAVAEKIEQDGYEWQCIDPAQCGSCQPPCAAWRLVGPCAGRCNPDRLQERTAGMDSADYYDKEDKAYANSRRLKERMDSGRFQADFTVLAFGETAAGDGGDKGDKNFRSMADGTDKDDKGLAARNDDGPDYAAVADSEAAAAGDKDDKGLHAAARGDDGGDRASARQRSADTSDYRAAEHAEVVADARHRRSARLGDALQSAGLAAVGAVVTLAVQGVYLLFRRHDSPRASVLEMQPVAC